VNRGAKRHRRRRWRRMIEGFAQMRGALEQFDDSRMADRLIRVVLLGRHAQQARMSDVHGASRRKKPESPAPSGEGVPGWVDENAVCFVRPATATCSGEESLDQRLLSGGRFGNALGKAPASRGVVQFAACSCFERARARRSSWRVSGSVRPAWSLWWRSQARFIESAEKSRTRSGLDCTT
jgi:hypothetical protein